MTSAQIRAKLPYELSEKEWLREIALQLAIANERGGAEQILPMAETVSIAPIKRKPGRPPKVKKAA